MRIFLVLLFVIAFHFEVKCQNYIPFPDSNSVWQVDWGVGGGGWPPGHGSSGSFQYYTNGDTTIGPFSYTKLEIQGGSTPLWYHFQFWNEYVGAYRNDSLENIVYFVPKDSTSEAVLYDFTLQVGDTIEGFLDQSLELVTGESQTVVINSIDSVQIGLNYRKRLGFTHLTVNSGWSGYFIEGIGGDIGLLECLHANLESNGSLSCFSVNDHVEYPTPSNSPCAPLSVEPNSGNFYFCPNPTQSFIKLIGPHTIKYFRLISIDGRKIKEGVIPETDEIDVRNIPHGVYVIQFMDKGFQTISIDRLLVNER